MSPDFVKSSVTPRLCHGTTNSAISCQFDVCGVCSFNERLVITLALKFTFGVISWQWPHVIGRRRDARSAQLVTSVITPTSATVRDTDID